MERGARADPSTAPFDAVYEDAKAAVSYAANELRSLTGQARAHVVDDDVSRERIVRLEAAVRSLERIWLSFDSERTAPVANADEEPLAILDAQEAERARIAREIHDGPAQALANASFRAEIALRLLGAGDSTAAGHEISELRAALDRELAELRVVITQLRPPVLDELGLDGAIREAARELLHDHDVRTELEAEASVLTPAERTVALRVAQEALRNIRKHARAGRVELHTRHVGDDWVLEISDDGVGFTVDEHEPESRRPHFGLRFMRERAELIEASLDVDSRPTGTRVRLTITPSEKRSSPW